MFPQKPPICFLDEPINPLIIEIFDYVEEGNLLSFRMLIDWARNPGLYPAKFNLQATLIQVNSLYSSAPPLPFEDDQPNI